MDRVAKSGTYSLLLLYAISHRRPSESSGERVGTRSRVFFGVVRHKMRIENEEVRNWFRTILILQTESAQSDSTAQRTELQRQARLLVAQQDRLLNLHFAGDIDQLTFANKQTELRDRLASIRLQLDTVDRSHDEWPIWR
jgi:hypothetical protein